ncbi:MAG: glycosyltransferase family 39 protein [Pseudomonadota bacterium]
MSFLDRLSILDRFTTRDPAPVARFWLWFAAILVAGTIARFWNLGGAPIWMDEAVTLGFARLDLWTLLTKNVDNHPPLTWVIQHIWHAINPDPDHARVPAATFGAMSVAAILLAMRDTAGGRAALFTGALFAFATAHVHYSQDARMYPFLIFGLILAAWGGLGHVRPNLHGPRTYAALYVIGGAIAIYSHILGLVVMALIGFASLVAGGLTQDRTQFAKDWFIRNIILFVITLPWLIQIPSAAGTFPGIAGDNSLTDIQWFFRNATGFPGLPGWGILLETVYFGLAGLSILIALRHGRIGMAAMLTGLIALFPIFVLALHISNPIMANKTLLAGIIGVTMGAGYALSRLKPAIASIVIAGVLSAGAFTSMANELTHRVKMEDYAGAFAHAANAGLGDAPVVTCVHFHAAAAWENRREGRILYYRRGDVLDYKGPDYWRAASRSMSWLRAADADEINAALGGDWLIEGGLEAALEGETAALFIRPNCPVGREDEILAGLQSIGFTATDTTRIMGAYGGSLILEEPLTRITLLQRAD